MRSARGRDDDEGFWCSIQLNDAPVDLAWELAMGWQPRGARKALRNFLEVVRPTSEELKSAT